MKTTRLTTHWDADQVMTVINMLDELRHALMDTYRHELAEQQNQCLLEQQEHAGSIDMFDDEIPF
jgi:phage-related protein